jgi:hypothetical protein
MNKFSGKGKPAGFAPAGKDQDEALIARLDK